MREHVEVVDVRHLLDIRGEVEASWFSTRYT